MKKVFLSLVLASGVFWASAQYNTLTLYYSTGKMEDAKKEVDKLLTDAKAKDKPETYLWKANVYAELFADSTLGPKYPEAGKEAFEALNIYAQKDPELKELKKEGAGMTRGVSLLYGGAFNYGRAAFQNKDWNKAFESFAFCQEVSEYIGKHSLSSNGKYTIDTTVVLYCGYSAQNANKPAEAAARYKALADWKINDKDFEDIYKFILDYDTKQKDEASFKKYLAIAKEAYPNDAPVWSQFEMNYMTSNTGLDQIISKYKSEDAAGKLNEDGYLTYAESFAMPDKDQADKLDSAKQVELKLSAADAFSKAYNLNNKNGLYAFNAGVLFYNVFSTLDDRFFANTGEAAALKAKRDEIMKEQKVYADKSIEWLEKAYNTLKAKDPREKNESNSLNRSVLMLSNLFAWKRDKSRGANPADYDTYDAKFKFYDAEVDKYK